MAKLQARLDRMREGFRAQASPEVLEVMHRSTEDLVASGQADRALAVGATMPAFRLPSQDGRTVTLADHLRTGPLVMTFFRGHW